MAKIGAALQEARLRKGLTLERVADDTNIGTRFLSKLENDDFTGFPGEPYIVGFIRNYAEYLGLEPEELVAAYRAPEGAETESPTAGTPSETPPEPAASPGPGERRAPGRTAHSREAPPAKAEASPAAPAAAEVFEENARRPKGMKRRGAALAAFFIAAAALAAAAVYFMSRGEAAAPPAETGKATVEYRAEGMPFEKRLYQGDSILVPLGNDIYKIRLESITDTVNLETPFGIRNLMLGTAGNLDADGDGTPDISLVIVDYEQGKPRSGALVRAEYAASRESGEETQEITVPAQGAEGAKAETAPRVPAVIMRSSRGPFPFVAQVSFRGNCMFRYEADRKEWVEKYYSKGDSISISVNNALMVWTSNAQAAKLSFQASGGKSADLEIGAPGEIAVKRISWVQSEGSWALVSTDMD